MKEKEINAIRTCHSTDAEQMLENIDDDITKVMDKYIKNGFISKNKELFFEDDDILDKYEYYVNGLKGLILDTHKIKWEYISSYYTYNNEEIETTSIKILKENKISKEEKEKWNNYLDDEMKLAEDNAKADLEAQDEKFGKYKI